MANKGLKSLISSGGSNAGLKSLLKTDENSSTALYNLATQSGLQADADKILKQKGEDAKQIFSGGFISDIFDVLNSLQYGVTGVLKGKSFGEGVRTRQSFSDQDALGSEGLPGVIAGIALDIAVDPLTYIAPWTILKKIPGLAKGAKAAKAAVFGTKVTKTIEDTADIAKGLSRTYETVEGGTQFGKYLAEKASWMFGVDPVFKETITKGIKNIQAAKQNVAEMVNEFIDLTPELASKTLVKDAIGRWKRVPFEELGLKQGDEGYDTIKALYDKIDNEGKIAAELGRLSPEKFEENVGEYIKNAYTEYEQSKKLFGTQKLGVGGIEARLTNEELASKFLSSSPEAKTLYPELFSSDGKVLLGRVNDSGKLEELAKKGFELVAKEAGQIDNPAYLMLKTLTNLTADNQTTRLFNEVAGRFGSDTAQEGFKKLNISDKWGALAGKYVPEHMHQYLTEIAEPFKDTINKKIVAGFKFGKVILNPATHIRNVISNQILNWWKLGMNPLDPRTWSANAEALRQMKKGGEFIKEAKQLGYGLNTMAANELKSLLLGNEVGKFGSAWKKTANKLSGLYQGEENFAKLSAFIFNRRKGLSPEDAWKAAESATFNYAQVTPFVRKLRENIWGMPFITFTTKATPLAISTILKAPQRVSSIGKIKQGIENLADISVTARERKAEPDWVKDGFYIKLPMKDKFGRSAYFDLTYIIPFGDLVSGNFFERATSRETGLPESTATALMKKSPLISIIRELSKNQDFYGDKIWNDADDEVKKSADIMRYLTKAYLPPLIADQIPGGYKEDGTRRKKGVVGATTASKENQQRTLMQEILRNIGAKIQPIELDIQENYMEWEKKKALETLLKENGILSEFTKTYIPKK